MNIEERPGLMSRFSAFVYDPVLAKGERRGMAARRRELLREAKGRVLELGAGTGLNLEHYPEEVERLVLSEPEAGMAARLRKRVAEAGRPVEVVQAAAEELPFADGSFDVVVSTMVLCTAADAERAIAEVRRVLAPGGRLLFIEHVRSEEAGLSRWQDRLEKPWAIWGSGCRCNQATEELLEREFRLTGVRSEEWDGMPKIVRPLRMGAAVPA
jgi:ubiquinone/menaquinone biosynthesis C-methylase UbiE